MEYTAEQQAVIEVRGKNTLVSAAAGSGKTAVLTARIIGIVSDAEKPVDIDRILVLTFTNLAAGEMRERIGKAISEKLEHDSENIHLQRQMTLLHNAQITTIHSFCLHILRNHFHAIGLDPAFRVVDEGELRLLKEDTMAEMLEGWYGQEDNQRFLDCVEYFSTGSSDISLEGHIGTLYKEAMSYPWPEEWLRRRKEDYAVSSPAELEKSGIVQYLLSYTENIVGDCISKLQTAQSICQEADGPHMYAAMIADELAALQQIQSLPPTFAAYQSAFASLSFDNLSAKKDDKVSKDKREQAKNIRNAAKETLMELKEDFFSQTISEAITMAKKISPAVETLVALVLDYAEHFSKAKRKKNIIDFGDMEHMVLQILLDKDGDEYVPTAAAKELRAHYVEVMCDEYQDSNRVQELLLQSLCGEEEGRFNRFMVGDAKQSIYKFRQARPEIFMEKIEAYPPLLSAGESNSCGIDLNKNFRSRQEVLDAVNYLFGHIMQKQIGGIAYDQKAALYLGMNFPENGQENVTELLLFDSSVSEETREEITGETANEMFETTAKDDIPDSAKESEARMVARRIKELMNGFQVTDKESGDLRPLNYRDIVILLRTTKGWDEVFKRILLAEGIPAVNATTTGYFAAPEIQTVLQTVAVLDNPRQDIPLFGVMKSFFGGFSEEEIALVKVHGQGDSLYGKLCSLISKPFANSEEETEAGPRPPAISEDLTAKIAKFTSFVAANRQKAAYTPITELLRDLIVESGYYHHAAVKLGGAQRVANLEMLLAKSASFADTGYSGLFHFVRYIEQLEKYEIDYGEANVLGEQTDTVCIMSIHKSKGLEFPVCFVAGLNKEINYSDSNGLLCLGADLGLGADFVDPIKRLRRGSLWRKTIGIKNKLDTLGEELRILYVAMTRAREKLILTGLGKQPEQAAAPALTFLQLCNTKSFLDLLLPLIAAEASEQDQSLFKIRVYKAGELQAETEADMESHRERYAALLQQMKEAALSSGLRQAELAAKFTKAYPYAKLANLYAKTTVTELKKSVSITEAMEVLDQDDAANEERGKALFDVPYTPSFATEGDGISEIRSETSAAARGSAYHRVMELLDFAGLPDDTTRPLEDWLAAGLEQHLETGRLTKDEKDAADIEQILAFCRTPLAARMAVAARNGTLRKEQPFVIGIAANRLDPDFPREEIVMIQGVIDSFFAEGEGLIVVDYKSDKVKNGAELVARYQTQLDYYQEALKQLCGKKVKEKLIYSFALKETIELP